MILVIVTKDESIQVKNLLKWNFTKNNYYVNI